MAATREQVMEALQTLLSTAYAFCVVTRRNTSPETIAVPGVPALVLVKAKEHYNRPTPQGPPKRVLTILAIVYINVSGNPNAIPDASLNAVQDAIDAALSPDDPSSNRCTLGGLVFSAMISGQVDCAPGDKTGQGLAVIPIEIILP